MTEGNLSLSGESPWLVPSPLSHGDSIKLRLFCFHYAGAGPRIFESWPSQLPQGVQQVGICLPGRDSRIGESFMTDACNIAAVLANEIIPWLDKPLVFFGHSIGALVCFETAKALRNNGQEVPRALVVSGRNAPQIVHGKPWISDLPDGAFQQAVKNFGGMPDSLLANPDMMAFLAPRMRADIAISEHYRFKDDKPLPARFYVLSGSDDRLTSYDGMQGWAELTTFPPHWIEFPGNHFFIHSAEKAVLRQLGEILRDTLQAHAGAKGYE